jgi:hypothetical protein
MMGKKNGGTEYKRCLSQGYLASLPKREPR